MAELETIKQQVKQALVEELMLPQGADEIGDDTALFSPTGLALDSVDALQLTVALEKRFGLKIPDAQTAREVLQSVSTIATAVVANGQA